MYLQQRRRMLLLKSVLTPTQVSRYYAISNVYWNRNETEHFRYILLEERSLNLNLDVQILTFNLIKQVNIKTYLIIWP